MKRIYITIASVLAACTLAGCTAIEEMPQLDSGIAANDVIAANDAPEAENDETSNSTTENSESLSGEIENNEIAAELPKLKVKIKEWDKDKINELFIEPRDDLVYRGYPEGGMFGGDYDIYTGEDYCLIFENGHLYNVTEWSQKYKKYGYSVLASDWGRYSFEEYFDDDEIALFSKEDAVSRTNALLDELGIKNYTKPDVYAVTADKANALIAEGWEDKIGTPHQYEKWTEDNEVYILSYSIEYDGVPLTVDYPDEFVLSEGEDANENIYLGSHILAIVSKDEIISLEAFYVISDEYEINGSAEVNCTEEQAVETALKCFDGEYDAVRVLDCEIVYLPIEKQSGEHRSITLVPVWKVNVSADNEFFPMRSYDSVHIDVSTGKPLTYKNKLLQ